MKLAANLKVFFPNSPSPPDPKIAQISEAFDSALRIHIPNSSEDPLGTMYFSPGFGGTFLAGIIEPTIFWVNLSTYLNSVVSPILATALAAEIAIETPLEFPPPPAIGIPHPVAHLTGHQTAWSQAQPSFDALYPQVPSFMIGPDGPLFWFVVVYTIRNSLISVEIPALEPSGGSSLEDGLITLEDSIE